MKPAAIMSGLGILLLGACSPLNTEFSCNATAGDRCLSIEEVNAMTESHEEHAGVWRKRVTAAPIKACKSCARKAGNDTRTIWVAPWKDAHGTLHRDDTLFAQIEGQTTLS